MKRFNNSKNYAFRHRFDINERKILSQREVITHAEKDLNIQKKEYEKSSQEEDLRLKEENIYILEDIFIEQNEILMELESERLELYDDFLNNI